MEKYKKKKNWFTEEVDEKEEKGRWFHENGLLNKMENEYSSKKSSKNGKWNYLKTSKKINDSIFEERNRLGV